mmetsp:Transcript_26929/g.48677  ORF Transcript_26929/g.48677 Transcript_26929/m.48677 type:complete len:134 (-) Transcript_26929:202-603(-)
MIAPGNVEQLNEFLDELPTLSRDKVFVDSSDGYEAYRAMNFGRLEFGKSLPDGLELQAPDMGGIGGWFQYLNKVVALSPKPAKGSEGGVPEGVTLLGGTLVVQDEQVTYAWADRIPGDHPKPQGVFENLPNAA